MFVHWSRHWKLDKGRPVASVMHMIFATPMKIHPEFSSVISCWKITDLEITQQNNWKPGIKISNIKNDAELFKSALLSWIQQ